MEATVQELLALQHDAAERQLTIREKTAAAFLAQFYNGVENILRVCSLFGAAIESLRALIATETTEFDAFISDFSKFSEFSGSKN